MFFVALVGLTTPTVYGASISDLEKQKAAKQAEITKNQAMADQKAAEAKDLTKQIDTLSGDIANTQSKINETSGQISQVNGEIATLDGQIEITKEQLDEENKKLDGTLVELYRTTNGSSYRSTLFMLLSSRDLASTMESGTHLTALQQQIDNKIAEVEGIKAEFERQSTAQKAKKDELSQLQSQQEAQKRSATAQKGYKDSLLGMTEDQKASYLASVDKLKSEITHISAQIYAERQKLLSGGSEKLMGGGSGYPYSAIDVPDAWGFLTRECTSYAAWYWNVVLGKRFINTRPGQGSAWNWPALAGDQGYSVSSTPRTGAIISWSAGGLTSQWGHVAIVEQVNSNGTIDVSEFNWIQYSYSYRANVNPGSYGSYSYIY